MKNMFYHRVSKLALRKEFEERVWKRGESFNEYLHDKVILANKVPVEKDLVEGIPDPILRDQARIQRLNSKASLLEAFEKVLLRPRPDAQHDFKKKADNPAVKTNKNDDGKGTRGATRYNCNDRGHLARECRQEKREQTKKETVACYKYETSGHIARHCGVGLNQASSGNKEQVMNVAVGPQETADFLRTIQYELVNKTDTVSLKLDSLFDTGNAVNFVKEKFVPRNVMTDQGELSMRFCGINNFHLRILSAVNVRMSYDDIVKEATLFVVPDDTMKPSVILGRDILKALGYSLKMSQDHLETRMEEILSIDVTDEKNRIADTLDINLELPISIQNKVRRTFEKDYCQPERPKAPTIDAELKLSLKDHQPFAVSPRRLSYVEKDILRKLLNQLLEKGIIKASESEYSSPIVLVKKKTGEYRMCIDYSTLNKYLIRNHYPIPLIKDQLEIVTKQKYSARSQEWVSPY